ncbi:hypothetical protein [Demequina sp.]|uniref:hypothetical protein n=1 Tax=Demequina sp. TaxID=2050685 RepID=UPI003D102E50
MPTPRRTRILVWSLVGLILLGAAVLFAFTERPVTTPRYPAAAWEGQGGTYAGTLDADVGDSQICWYILSSTGTRVGMVLPDTYRAFKLSVVQRGTSGAAPFISGTSLFAGDKIAQYPEPVVAVGRPAVGDGWLAQARAEWDHYCDPSVETVIVVEPGTLGTPEA